MPKLKPNERGIEALYLEIDHHKREKSELRRENDSLRNQNTMLKEALDAILSDESYLSETAIKSGVVWRLKNFLKNIS